MNILKRSFYQRSTARVAKDLLGKIIIRQIGNQTISGIIIETEAYGAQDDKASHAYSGKNKRNPAMFDLVGHSYVYLSYGAHYCLNLVARNLRAQAGGVLIRSLLPLTGIEVMQRLRNRHAIEDLTNGPGKIGQALNLNLLHNGIDLTVPGELCVVEGIIIPTAAIEVTPRVGISKSHRRRWRFVVKKEFLDQMKAGKDEV